MNNQIVIDCIFLVCVAYFGFFGFGRKRVRANWAKCIFAACGLIGITKGVVSMALDLGWIEISSNANYVVRSELDKVEGLLLGLIISLIVSGQFLGTKRAETVSGH